MAFNSLESTNDFRYLPSKKINENIVQVTSRKSKELELSDRKSLFKTADLEDQFKAACDAIQNLPKNGPFQPSNEILLKFYGYYKQATAGPCKKARPSMFSVIERSKWDAWNQFKDLNKTEAMQGYVNEIKNIIETMPHDKYVQKLTEILEPADSIYEYISESSKIQNKKEILNIIDHSDMDIETEFNPAIKDQNIEITANKDLMMLRLPSVQKKTNWNEWASIGSSNINLNSISTNRNFIPLKDGIIYNPFENEINHKRPNGDSAADSSPSYCEKTSASLASDDEEDYCDTSDRFINDHYMVQGIKEFSAENQQDLFDLKNNASNPLSQNIVSTDLNNVDKCPHKETNANKIMSSLIQKCGGELNSSQMTGLNSASGSMMGNSQVRQSRPGSSMSMGNNSRSMGAGGSGGGYPPNESYNFTMGQETNRQILSILIRIQQDTNNVITRLSYLEATVLSLQNNLQMNRIEKTINLNGNDNQPKTSAFLQFNARSSIESNFFSFIFSFLKSIDWKTVAIALAWPFIIRLAFFVVNKLKVLM